MIRPLSLSILVSLSSVSSWAVDPKPCPVAPLRESKITAEGLTKYLAIFNKKSTSIEDFVCCLPEQFRQSIAVAHSSIAAQNSRPESPRVIMSNFVSGKPPTKFLSINGGHPDLNQSNSVEMVLVDDKTGEVTLHDISFSKDGAKVSEPNPPLCLKCHGNSPHLIFEGPELWPRFVNGMTLELGRESRYPFAAGVSKEMLTSYFSTKESAAKKALLTNPRYRCLTKEIPSVNFLIEFDDAIEEQNEARIARLISESKDFRRYKYAILGQSVCSSAQQDLDCQLSHGGSCRNWLAAEALRELSQTTLLSREIDQAKDGNELRKAIQKEKEALDRAFKKEMSQPLYDGERIRSVTERITGILMRGTSSDLEKHLSSFKSLLMKKYESERVLSGSSIPAGLRLLFEARGISLADKGTDIASGYERLRVSGPALAKHETDPALRAKFASILFKSDEDKVLFCEELRTKSLASSRLDRGVPRSAPLSQ